MIHLRLITAWLFITLFFLLSASNLYSQVIVLPNAYAHNDYWHKRPLLDALEQGFVHMEADIFLKNENLIVAHFMPMGKKHPSLEELYMVPLLTYVNNNNGINSRYPITLMIDIKSDGQKTFKVLEILLEKYKHMLTSYEEGQVTVRKVTVVITGHRPYDFIKQKKSRLAFIDEDLKTTGKDSSTNIYPIASCKYSNLLKWKGKGTIPKQERQELMKYVTRAHLRGRKVRLWASPENRRVWSELLRCKVDLINTDHLSELSSFLRNELPVTAKTE